MLAEDMFSRFQWYPKKKKKTIIIQGEVWCVFSEHILRWSKLYAETFYLTQQISIDDFKL